MIAIDTRDILLFGNGSNTSVISLRIQLHHFIRTIFYSLSVLTLSALRYGKFMESTSLEKLQLASLQSCISLPREFQLLVLLLRQVEGLVYGLEDELVRDRLSVVFPGRKPSGIHSLRQRRVGEHIVMLVTLSGHHREPGLALFPLRVVEHPRIEVIMLHVVVGSEATNDFRLGLFERGCRSHINGGSQDGQAG
ncbi:hypothetical protein K402DRAFT_36607 [Aulographum hederae CBS 113979]|uniref:Uncharacterized protein n=1 Tax=Aulographum hederae CBS 113979 TaxID=1176131 RepID=A0A6G1H4G3_9PEZI|nr:hypothetical protein K402DRAFT_36607 [Aulographum hederae CBS 113979]